MLSLNIVKPLRGFIAYRGRSQINGDRIILIVNGLCGSANSKTGNMVQSYILVKNIDPVKSYVLGQDQSICGNCVHKRKNLNSCYVNIGQGPLAVYKAYERGSYNLLTLKEFSNELKGKYIRLGSFGDPAAIPYSVWKKILSLTAGHVGYTHQWRLRKFSEFKNICMASCDSKADVLQARKLGWRTFRVRKLSEKLLKGEFECPASREQNYRLTCKQCLACNGGHVTRASPAIYVHGLPFKINNFERNHAKT